MSIVPDKYYPSMFDRIENYERYQPGGFYPVCIGEAVADGRYTIVHKLGAGGSSTIWLARDRDRKPDNLVAVKILRADISSTSPEELPDLAIPALLREYGSRHSMHPVLEIYDHFIVNSPNGIHRAIVFPFCGVSIAGISWSFAKYPGARRLRGDLAQSAAKQIALIVRDMHATGTVHGDITASNIVFRTSEHVQQWTDTELYAHLGVPEEEPMLTIDAKPVPVGLHAPQKLCEFVDRVRFQDYRFMKEEVVLIDFGQAFNVHQPPSRYYPATAMTYWSPEMRFEGRIGFEADIWGLACAIFHMRTGCSLFDGFWGSPDIILRKTVETLGKLPDPWWQLYHQRIFFFHEDGSSKTVEERTLCGGGPWPSEGSIREKLRSVGRQDLTTIDDILLPPGELNEGPMCEKAGVSLGNEEVELLGDLLERMLAYRPEERLTIGQVLEHPWFKFQC